MSLERQKLSGPYSAPALVYIYDILVIHAGAREEKYEENQFVQCALEWGFNDGFEYRFQGSLGFGGKIWLPVNGEPYVTCYQEDETLERRWVMEKTNKELKKILPDALV